MTVKGGAGGPSTFGSAFIMRLKSNRKIAKIKSIDVTSTTVAINGKVFLLNPANNEIAICGKFCRLNAGSNAGAPYASISPNNFLEERFSVTGSGLNSEAGGYGTVSIIKPTGDIAGFSGAIGGPQTSIFGSAFVIILEN